MARFMKKAVAFALVLTTIFLFSTSAFATEIETATGSYCNYGISVTLTHGARYVTTTVMLTEDSSNATNLNVDISIDYVYGPADALKPSNYRYGSKAMSFNESVDGLSLFVRTSDVPSNHVILEATATVNVYLDGETTEHEFCVLTIYPY